MPNSVDTQSVKTLLLGGGYSLERLARKLDPNSFVITSRNSERVDEFKTNGFIGAQGDISDRNSLEALFKEYPSIETIIDSVPPLKEGSPEDGVKNLLAVLPSSVERIIYLGTTGVYGKRDGSIVTEKDQRTPLSGQSKARVIVEDEYQNSPVPVTTLRLSGIYGPGRGIGVRLKAGKYTQLDDGTRWTNRIHVEDIVGVLEKIIKNKKELPPFLNLSDNEPTEMKKVIDFYCDKFSFNPPEQISSEDAEKSGRHRLLLNQRVDNSLLKETLQYSFTFPSYKDGAGTEL